MLIYHGTSIRNIKTIIEEGIKPSQDKCFDVPVNLDEFCYIGMNPVFYAINSCWDGSNGVIFQIKLTNNDKQFLYPDSEYINHGTQDKFEILKRMNKFKALAHQSYLNTPNHSMAFKGCISPQHIIKYAIIDWKERRSMTDLICISNINIAEYIFDESLWNKNMNQVSRKGISIYSKEIV